MKVILFVSATIEGLTMPDGTIPDDEATQVIPFNNLRAISRQRIMSMMDTIISQAEVRAEKFNVATAIMVDKN